MNKQIVIDHRFRGPKASANGGYTAGILASVLAEGAVEVRLHKPPPLKTPLMIESERDTARLLQEDNLIAVAKSCEMEFPTPPSLDQRMLSTALDKPLMSSQAELEECFVCGPKREVGDGLRIFSSAVSGKPVVASYWLPDASLGDKDFLVREEFLWAALDCPGYFAHQNPQLMALLGSMTAQVYTRPAVNQRLLSVAWQLKVDGRKYQSATALLTQEGQVVAQSVQMWIELR